MPTIDLNDPEVKAAIAEAVRTETEGLAAKRDELLAEVRTLKRKGGTADPAQAQELARLEDERDGFKTRAEKAERDLAKAETRATDATKRAEAAEGARVGMLKDASLSEALTKVGVTNPAHLKAARAMLAGEVSIEAEGDKSVAKAGGKSLTDFVTEWAKGDEGKYFVAAPANSGGGSGGGGGASGAKPFSEMSGTERAVLYRENPAEFQRQSDAAARGAK